MKAKILEVFDSIQGEGKYLGAKQVFVRFFECNMHCVWCDTPHSIGDTSRKYDEIELDDLLAKVQKISADSHSISLTGGEPLMQAEFLKEFMSQLKEAGHTTYLETNGTFPKELKKVLEVTDIIAMDLKLPSSTQCKPFWKEHEKFLEIGLEKDLFIKTVVSLSTSKEDIEKSVELVSEADPDTTFILQPNYFEMKDGVMKKCLEFHHLCATKLNDVRIIPQTHKFMKLR